MRTVLTLIALSELRHAAADVAKWQTQQIRSGTPHGLIRL